MTARPPAQYSTSHLASAKPPWTVLLVVKAGQLAEPTLKIPDGFVLRVLRGAKCRTTAGLLAEFAHALDFPDYFGHNWDALEECLTDLEWLTGQGYVLLVTDAEQVLARDEEEYATFLEVLSDVGEAWASRQTGAQSTRRPFHTVLAVSESHTSRREQWGVPRMTATATRTSSRRRRSLQ
jgi:hypothetical protein